MTDREFRLVGYILAALIGILVLIVGYATVNDVLIVIGVAILLIVIIELVILYIGSVNKPDKHQQKD